MCDFVSFFVRLMLLSGIFSAVSVAQETLLDVSAPEQVAALEQEELSPQPETVKEWRSLLCGSWVSKEERKGGLHFLSFGVQGDFCYSVMGSGVMFAYMEGEWKIDKEGKLVTSVLTSELMSEFEGRQYCDQVVKISHDSIEVTYEDGSVCVFERHFGWH